MHGLTSLALFGTVVIICTSVDCKKNILKASTELLERELSKIKNPQTTCAVSNISLKDLNHLRMTRQIKRSLVCHLLYLQAQPSDGWVWSSLGQVYLDEGSTKSVTQASTCFKQASKLDGSIIKDVKKWHFLGPFVIGKMEVDGDPLENYGGIRNVSKYCHKKGETFYSELANNGVITWTQYHGNNGEVIQIQPQLAWNDLVNSLGSTGITEWQGWLVGEFAINANNVEVLIQCLGVHTVYINDVPLTGDVYHRDPYHFAVSLSKGIHVIYIPLRAKVKATVRCTIDTATERFRLHQPHYNPQLVNGYLFSDLLYIPITNLQSNKWLKLSKISVEESTSESSLIANFLEGQPLGIAPGQTRPIPVRLTSDQDSLTSSCSEVTLRLKVTTSEGQSSVPITLACRKPGESFVFTFLDHDGSVQHAAGIPPLESCEMGVCPVLLTLHGTTVPAQNQADSYKRGGPDGGFIFGLEKAWVLAPTRHGAHNWEGPGALTALTALKRFSDLTEKHHWMKDKASSKVAIFAGHSMGGHGAWHLAAHYPDMALALISLAGWIKKEEYGDSNLFFRHDIAASYVDPSIKAILEACVAENEADKHVSNLKGISVLTRIGSQDRTIHPYFVRRMYRLLQEWGIDVTYSELPGKEHWWWDTKSTNDGGCVNDPALRDFTNKHAALPRDMLNPVQCDDDGENCEGNIQKHNKYSSGSDSDNFTYTVVNPALGGSNRGLYIIQQETPFRTSLIQAQITPEKNILKTTNVRIFSIVHSYLRQVNWVEKTLLIDSTEISADNVNDALHHNKCFCREKALWATCDGCHSLFTMGQRGPSDLGPARRIAEAPFLIVIGTVGSDKENKAIEEFAVYIANLFFLTSDTNAPIIKDRDLKDDMAAEHNLIIIGSPQENSWTELYLAKIPVDHNEDLTVKLGSCLFSEADLGLLFLAPHSQGRLALVLMGTSYAGLQDAVSLATPTIPPMTRSPFSNLVADFVITGPHYRAQGPGGYLCTGFWGNQWELRTDLISCSYCAS